MKKLLAALKSRGIGMRLQRTVGTPATPAMQQGIGTPTIPAVGTPATPSLQPTPATQQGMEQTRNIGGIGRTKRKLMRGRIKLF